MKTERSLVLVTGAAGWIGRRVCQHLRVQGMSVVAFDRVVADGPWDRSFVGALDCFADLPDDLRRLLEKTSAVVHCAGRAHQPVETAAEIEAFVRTNVGGTRELLMACKATGVERVVYVSTIAGYNFSNVPAEGVEEEAPLATLATAYARTKLEGEALVRESGLDWRVARLATVFGAGDRANFAKLARALKSGRFAVPGTGAARKSIIPVDLAAGILVRLALANEMPHRLMNVALPYAPTLREICDTFSTECGFHRARAVPLGVLRFGALLGDGIARWSPGFPLTTTNLAKITTSTVVNPTRLYQALPDLPRATFAEALQDAAEFYRNA